jgi:hypothetical protein
MIFIDYSTCLIFNIIPFYNRDKLLIPTITAGQDGKLGHP